jgi:pimeloyl-ACP methyl ester carboxylesterase
VGYRRIYPDLPGMGRSTTDGLTCNDDVVKLLSDFIDHLGEGPAMLAGHSYGAYLARGLAAKRPDMVLGLALFCPVAERSRNVPDHDVVRRHCRARCDQRRSTTAKGTPPARLSDPHALLEVAAARAYQQAAAALRDAVTCARQAGHPWSTVAAILGVTRQAAQQRFASTPR